MIFNAADSIRQARLDALIKALIDEFGERAVAIARRQRDLAGGENADNWAIIVERLEGLTD